MSDDKYEIHYYPELCEKLGRYLIDQLGDSYKISFSQNKQLGLMVNEICHDLGVARPDEYFPALKTDIAFGVKKPDESVVFCLIEVKRAKSLALMNFSQLVGYMQVAKHIKIGLLILVNEGNVGRSPLSTDFSSIIDIGQLPSDWRMITKNSGETFDFTTGICMYTVNNGIDWIPTDSCSGISNWSSFVKMLIE